MQSLQDVTERIKKELECLRVGTLTVKRQEEPNRTERYQLGGKEEEYEEYCGVLETRRVTSIAVSAGLIVGAREEVGKAGPKEAEVVAQQMVVGGAFRRQEVGSAQPD